MPVVYCLIRTAVGKEWEIAKKIRKLKYVTEAFPVYGDWDVIVRIESKVYEVVDEVITKIRSMESIIETKTLFGP